MEKYKLLGIKKRKSKQDKEYFVCFLSLETDYDFNVINVIINEKQVEPISKVLNDNNFDVSKFLSLKYNSFTKSYNLVLNYGN